MNWSQCGLVLLSFLTMLLLTRTIICAQQMGDLGNCGKRQENQLEEGRSCKVKCKRPTNTCTSKRRTCICDDICGLSCIRLDWNCSALAPVSNANGAPSSLQFRSTVRYECNDGYYKSSGSLERKCRSDKKWSGNAPVCERGCAMPGRWNMGYADIRSSPDFYKVGSQVQYLCGTGYRIVGSESARSRTCQPDSTWSLPQFQCVLLNCGRPPAPQNGFVRGDEFSFGRSVQVGCDEGYVLEPARSGGQFRRTCYVSGGELDWRPANPSCQRRSCDAPPELANGSVADDGVLFEYEAVVVYHCNAGYAFPGAVAGVRRMCGADGTWGEALPRCQVEVGCDFEDHNEPTCSLTNEGWTRMFIEHDYRSSRGFRAFASRAGATLTSQAFDVSRTSCLKFHYELPGGDVSWLAVSLIADDTGIETELWKKRGRSDWSEARVVMKPQAGQVRYLFTASSRGVGIDDVTLSPCGREETTTATAATFPTTTTETITTTVAITITPAEPTTTETIITTAADFTARPTTITSATTAGSVVASATTSTQLLVAPTQPIPNVSTEDGKPVMCGAWWRHAVMSRLDVTSHHILMYDRCCKLVSHAYDEIRFRAASTTVTVADSSLNPDHGRGWTVDGRHGLDLQTDPENGTPATAASTTAHLLVAIAIFHLAWLA